MQESVSMLKSPTPVSHSRVNQAMSKEEEKERLKKKKIGGTGQVKKKWGKNA